MLDRAAISAFCRRLDGTMPEGVERVEYNEQEIVVFWSEGGRTYIRKEWIDA